MPHGDIKRLTNAEGETGKKVSAQIVLTLLGGVLFLTSLAASFLFESPFYSNALALISALLLTIPIFEEALSDLIHGRARMNELVALAVLAAFAIGDYKTAAAVAFLMVLFGLVENRTALGARARIESLIRITPTRAARLTDGTETEVEAKDLRPGDLVRIRPGDNIPGDGKVVAGVSTVNQATITGESLPVDKSAGDEVFGGTINLTGVLEVEIAKSGADTTLGRVQELILQAECTRTPITRLIDQYAAWYTPTVLMLAGVVLFFTRDMERAISILVISCPCAIVLATPTAMVAALSAAARLGVLIKNVADLETARKVSAIIFDKTGTLTTGRLSVTRLRPIDGVDGAQLLQAAAAAEHNSRHPTARAVQEVARRARIPEVAISEFEEIPGRGVRAVVDSVEILVGRATWLTERGITIPEATFESTEGLSLLFVAKNGALLGYIALEDKTRPDAAKSMDELRNMGIRHLAIITGDRASVARRVAAEMHCTEYFADVLPEGKLELVDALKQRGHVVAVVGDGVNDAPALAAGHISIAMGAAGSDVAIHTASIALMNENLGRIPFLIQLSRRTTQVVRQNLIFGMIFIGGLVALSAYGKIPPIWAAVFHEVGSLAVLFNSARLVREGECIDAADGQTAISVPAPRGIPVPSGASA